MHLTRLGFALALYFQTMAVGAEQLPVPGGSLTIEWQDDFSQREQQKIRTWLEHAGHAASTLTGRSALDTTSISIHRAQRGKGPVPWAHTVRSGPTEGVVFHVNPNKPLKAFQQDWTAVHEFSHLYLPYIGREDSWLSEGFASYYQYILMMRHKTLNHQTGWQWFKDGFSRGAADPYQIGTLRDASRKMRARRAFKRVYWSGALYFLEVDLALRAKGSSLDQVIRDFQLCCRFENRSWSGLHLVQALDRTSGTTVFTRQYDQYLATTGFPDYETVLARLGIYFSGKKITLSEHAHHERLRLALTQPTPAAKSQ